MYQLIERKVRLCRQVKDLLGQLLHVRDYRKLDHWFPEVFHQLCIGKQRDILGYERLKARLEYWQDGFVGGQYFRIGGDEEEERFGEQV